MKQAASARLAAHVDVAQTHEVRLQFDADESEHAGVRAMARDEPAVARAVAERIAAAFAAHGGAREEASHVREERRFVVDRAPLKEFAVVQQDHECFSPCGVTVATSRREKPNDSERAMSCFSSDTAIRRHEGCARRFSSAGTPASGHVDSG